MHLSDEQIAAIEAKAHDVSVTQVLTGRGLLMTVCPTEILELIVALRKARRERDEARAALATARDGALEDVAALCDATRESAKAKLATADHPIPSTVHAFARGTILTAESLAWDIRSMKGEKP